MLPMCTCNRVIEIECIIPDSIMIVSCPVSELSEDHLYGAKKGMAVIWPMHGWNRRIVLDCTDTGSFFKYKRLKSNLLPGGR